MVEVGNVIEFGEDKGCGVEGRVKGGVLEGLVGGIVFVGGEEVVV